MNEEDRNAIQCSVCILSEYVSKLVGGSEPDYLAAADVNRNVGELIAILGINSRDSGEKSSGEELDTAQSISSIL